LFELWFHKNYTVGKAKIFINHNSKKFRVGSRVFFFFVITVVFFYFYCSCYFFLFIIIFCYYSCFCNVLESYQMGSTNAG